MKRQPTLWEKIFANHIGLICDLVGSALIIKVWLLSCLPVISRCIYSNCIKLCFLLNDMKLTVTTWSHVMITCLMLLKFQAINSQNSKFNDWLYLFHEKWPGAILRSCQYCNPILYLCSLIHQMFIDTLQCSEGTFKFGSVAAFLVWFLCSSNHYFEEKNYIQISGVKHVWNIIPYSSPLWSFSSPFFKLLKSEQTGFLHPFYNSN